MVYTRFHHVVEELWVEGPRAPNVAIIVDGSPCPAWQLSDHEIGVLDIFALLVYDDLALVSRNDNAL
jgi:hypothetical protein